MKELKAKLYQKNVSGFNRRGGKMGKVWDEVKYCSDKCRSNK
jgi:hypothetical protein